MLVHGFKLSLPVEVKVTLTNKAIHLTSPQVDVFDINIPKTERTTDIDIETIFHSTTVKIGWQV